MPRQCSRTLKTSRQAKQQMRTRSVGSGPIRGRTRRLPFVTEMLSVLEFCMPSNTPVNIFDNFGSIYSRKMTALKYSTCSGCVKSWLSAEHRQYGQELVARAESPRGFECRVVAQPTTSPETSSATSTLKSRSQVGHCLRRQECPSTGNASVKPICSLLSVWFILCLKGCRFNGYGFVRSTYDRRLVSVHAGEKDHFRCCPTQILLPMLATEVEPRTGRLTRSCLERNAPLAKQCFG